MTDQTNEEVTPTQQLVGDDGQPVTLEQALEAGEPKKEEVAYPEWLPEKFKTGEDWADKLGQSYTELEKTLREKGKVAPEKYDIADDIKAKIDPENLEAFETLAKENKLNQDQYIAVLKYAEENGLLDMPDHEAEMAKLGEQGEVIINSLNNYANKNLTPEQKEEMEGMVFNAEQAQILYNLIQKADKQIPAKAGENFGDNKNDLQRQLEAIIENPKTKYDASLQKEAEMLARRMAGMQ